ncbi:MAG: hypothetical protein K0R46_1325 [Herbinix sp.]|jgi:hypothetical protein|nr:hypothetical protein [Herbinix sp.]
MKQLKDPVFRPFSVKEIKPQGWLLGQLQIQAKGLSGNLDLFWPDIKDSRWIGGSREGWERLPYWLDGFIPLAWLLDDEDKKKRVKEYIDFIIEHQDEDGWICPGDLSNRAGYDMWALLLVLKVLVQYQEITGDGRIEGVITKALLSLDRHIDNNLLFSWAQSRWFEGLIPIWWLYERTGEQWLLHLASKLHSQGFDWISFFKDWPYRVPDQKGRWSQMSHAVNIAMALKSGALYSRMTDKEEELHSADQMVELLDHYHGMITGAFSGDECLSGNSPVQGTELCAIAEYMYSLEQLISLTGKTVWGDRLEKLAFNALPATYSPDMWTHQYDQQVNQVECSKTEEPIFLTNGGEANLFGLEPNFGCCTANLSQPWPKFALNTMMKSEDGVAVVLYSPTVVTTVIHDVGTQIKMETDYPFQDTIHFTVVTDKPVRFTIQLRIPDWCEEAILMQDDKQESINQKGFYGINRIWEGDTEFTLQLPMKVKLEGRPNNLSAITRGPLVYSLAIGERWVQVNENIEGREYPHCDYEIFATTPWNYGIRITDSDLEQGLGFRSQTIGTEPFSPKGAPVRLTVKGSKIDWRQEHGAATPVPAMTWISQEIEELTLIPYGCTNLRMTEMPLLKY